MALRASSDLKFALSPCRTAVTYCSRGIVSVNSNKSSWAWIRSSFSIANGENPFPLMWARPLSRTCEEETEPAETLDAFAVISNGPLNRVAKQFSQVRKDAASGVTRIAVGGCCQNKRTSTVRCCAPADTLRHNNNIVQNARFMGACSCTRREISRRQAARHRSGQSHARGRRRLRSLARLLVHARQTSRSSRRLRLCEAFRSCPRLSCPAPKPAAPCRSSSPLQDPGIRYSRQRSNRQQCGEVQAYDMRQAFQVDSL